MHKKLFVWTCIAACYATSAFALENSCANFPRPQADVVMTPQGVKAISTASVSVPVDDIEVVNDAFEEATIAAKVEIVKFLKEKLASSTDIEKKVNELSNIQKQGDSQSVTFNRDQVKTTLKKMHNSAEALLRGVVVLGQCYTKGREVRVTVGIKPETIAQAGQLSQQIGESLARQPTVSSESGNSYRGSSSGLEGSGQGQRSGTRGVDGFSDTSRIKNF